MLTCPNCGSENRYGAIFCRVCGKKLDIIDELTVENIDEKTRGKKRRRKKDKSELPPKKLRHKRIILHAVRIVVILLVSFAVYLTQQTPSLSAIATSEGSRRSFLQKKRRLRAGTAVTVTVRELNSYVAGLVTRVKPGKVLRFENVQVAVENGSGKVAVRMYVRLFGKRMLFQLFGKLEKSNGGVKFSPATFARIGKLPYPLFLMKLHCKKMLSELKSDVELFNDLTEVTVKEVKTTRGRTTGIVLKSKKKS